MSDDEQDSGTGPSHEPGTRQGQEGPGTGEAGRDDHGETGAGRPAGGAGARMSTGINAENEEPIDPASPNLPPP